MNDKNEIRGDMIEDVENSELLANAPEGETGFPEEFAEEAAFEFGEDSLTDAEADADTLASAGMGTDEDYGSFGGEDSFLDGSYEM